MDVDLNFIQENEGFRSYGIWPSKELSGLTIGSGIDLSNFTKDDLIEAGVTKEDVKNASRWLAPKAGTPGPRGAKIMTKGNFYDAADRINGVKVGSKVNWSEESLNNMHIWALKGSYNNAKKVYEKLTKRGGLNRKFEDLTKAQKTVLVDLTYNAGANFIISKTTALENAIEKDDWSAIEGEFSSNNWAELDRARHHKRADLLASERFKE